MKPVYIIFVFALISFLSPATSAQTKQELNIQLRDNLEAFKSYYERWLGELKTSDMKLTKMIAECDSAAVRNEQRQATELSDAFALLMKRYDQLKRLGKNPAAIVSIPEIKAQMARFEYRNVAPDLSEVKRWSLVKEEFGDVVPPEKMNLNDQNRWMEQKLQSVKKADSINHSNLYRVEAYKKTVQSAKLKLDSLYLEYQDLLNTIAVEEQLLKDSIRNLRYFSLSSYPNNFSSVYEREFGQPIEGLRTESIDPVSYIYPTEMDDEFVKYAYLIPMEKFSVTMLNDKRPVDLSDQTAEFPGGKLAMNKYLLAHLQIPEKAEEIGVRGKVVVKFMVSKAGKISDVKIIRGFPECPECDAEVVRVVKTMPDWIPGKIRGRKSDSYYQLPVTFNAN